MKIIERNNLRRGGFAGLRETRLVMSPRIFRNQREPGTSAGIGRFVYLADARFLPHGDTRMHEHREIDVISVMVEGRIQHEGSLEHGQELLVDDIQVQRAGGEGFSHNEINPDDSKNRMIQLWVIPETPDEPAAYQVFKARSNERTRVYGGLPDQNHFRGRAGRLQGFQLHSFRGLQTDTCLRNMICKPFNCIFVHIPKTAGRSVEMFFMNKLDLDRENDEHRKQLLITDNTDPDRGTEKLSHLSAAEYVQCGHVPQQEFSKFYKFSFVRNPWARLVSEYRYRNYLSHRSFKDFVMNKLPAPGRDDKYRHIMPQTEMLCDNGGNLLVDFVGKFEQLQQDFDKVCKQLGFEDSSLSHVNSSDKKSRELRRKVRNFLYRNDESYLHRYVDFYDTESREFVTNMYRQDIDNFGYDFGDALKNQ
jgi:hypothetical protein